jgi:hypothetical protein
VVEGVLRPVDPPGAALDERDMRSCLLEVEESLWLDLREAFGFPRLREIAAGE